jgi:predicted nucleotidyltransferase
MQPVSEELLEEITNRLVAELQPEEIVLFGSRAWGNPREDSDVDLLIIMPADEFTSPEHQLRARRCLRDIDVPKDILMRTRSHVDRFRSVPASLEALILGRGRVLYAGRQAGAGTGLADQGAA